MHRTAFSMGGIGSRCMCFVGRLLVFGAWPCQLSIGMSTAGGLQRHKSSHTSPQPMTYVNVACVCVEGGVSAIGVSTFCVGADGSLWAINVSVCENGVSAWGDDVSVCESWEGGDEDKGGAECSESQLRARESGLRDIAVGGIGIASVVSSM